MQLLRFFSRVAFICNICFLVASFAQWLPDALQSDILGVGYFLGMFINLFVNVAVIVFLLAGRLRASAVPVWLLIVNFVFFIVQLLLLIVNRHLT